MANTKKNQRLTPVQRTAMTEAVDTYLGRMPNGLKGRTIDALLDRGLVYEGDNRGRRIKLAILAGYTGFSSYYLTRAGYEALGLNPWLSCSQCEHGRYAANRDGRPGYRCTSDECDHEITYADLEFEPGEYAELRDGRLALLWREPKPSGEPGTDAGHCAQCQRLLVWDRTGKRAHDERGEYLCSTGRNSQATSATHVLIPAEPAEATESSEGAPAAAADEDQAVEPARPAPLAPGESTETVWRCDRCETVNATADMACMVCGGHQVGKLHQLTSTVHAAGGTYYADGTRVIRLYPAEGQPVGVLYQDYCPCCGDQTIGTTAGMITPEDELRPLQRVQWPDHTADWPPHLLQRVADDWTPNAEPPAAERPAVVRLAEALAELITEYPTDDDDQVAGHLTLLDASGRPVAQIPPLQPGHVEWLTNLVRTDLIATRDSHPDYAEDPWDSIPG
ncbi:hypothetical protein ACGF07_32085 [Kitasatospora sp. NPDC048194]|uniref:hypothetical protein n=1 Tax=Kitasatospora sp. NPDC048194 TaxID=3364045 RepID=UPI003716F037